MARGTDKKPDYQVCQSSENKIIQFPSLPPSIIDLSKYQIHDNLEEEAAMFSCDDSTLGSASPSWSAVNQGQQRNQGQPLKKIYAQYS